MKDKDQASRSAGLFGDGLTAKAVGNRVTIPGFIHPLGLTKNI